MTDVQYPYVWRWKSRLPERHGHRCRRIKHGGMNSVLIEFEDGFRVLTSRWAIRRVEPDRVLPPDFKRRR